MMSVRKSLGRACSMGLRAAEKLTLGRSRPPHTSQIHCWDTAGTPFRTVSLGTLVSRANPEPLSRDCDNGGARIRMPGWEGRTYMALIRLELHEHPAPPHHEIRQKTV